MNCGKEDWERERAMLSEMHSDGSEAKPSSSKRSSTNLLPPTAEMPAGPGALAAVVGAHPGAPAARGKPLGCSGWHQAALPERGWEKLRAGKGSGPLASPLACTEWPGGGELDRTQKGH